MTIQEIEALEQYSDGNPVCFCCGETTIEFLGLDHMDNDGVIERQITGGGHAAYRWLKTHGWPERNYKVACLNCNSARYYYGSCPHRKQMVVAEYPIKYLGEHLDG